MKDLGRQQDKWEASKVFFYVLGNTWSPPDLFVVPSSIFTPASSIPTEFTPETCNQTKPNQTTLDNLF